MQAGLRRRAVSVHSTEWMCSTYPGRNPSMSRISVSRLASAFAMAGVLAACADSPTTSSPASPSDLAPQDVPAYSAGVAAAAIPGRFIVTLRDGADARGVAREHGAARAGLLRDARVERIEQDGVATAQGTQTGATWGLDRTDQRYLPLNTTYSYTNTG